MKDMFLVNYSVQGIKALDKKVSLSFYKKTITKDLDTKKYNMKAIYGMNGSGKSAIIASVDIFRNLLYSPGYLANPIVQKNLDELINKKTRKLDMAADFISDMGGVLKLFHYEIALEKDFNEKYVIASEKLSSRKAQSKSEKMDLIYEVKRGELLIEQRLDESSENIILGKTANLLEQSPLCELFAEKRLIEQCDYKNKDTRKFIEGVVSLFLLGGKIHVFIENTDNHRAYVFLKTVGDTGDEELFNSLFDSYSRISSKSLRKINVRGNSIEIDYYNEFEQDIKKLSEFIRIFKPELQEIEIDKKENEGVYICNLVMKYEDFRVDSEYESTGVKKLIELYVYLREMVQGGIVFIDEFDSNLHDVYLCALLEYLMEYGEGQICFTTHNVGPMDVLKQNKKSIDFLSVDHTIYPWITNGNYSPSKLYRGGMIEGSPFNVDSIDFIGVFDMTEE